MNIFIKMYSLRRIRWQDCFQILDLLLEHSEWRSECNLGGLEMWWG